MPASIDEVKLELVHFFGDRITGSRFFDDYARIGSFLSDPGKYMPALRTLHTEMEHKLDHNMDRWFMGGYLPALRSNFKRLLIETYRTMEGGRPSPPPSVEIGPSTHTLDTAETMAVQAFRKILTDVLKENEIANGLQVGGVNNKPDIILGNAGKEFNTLLKEKRAFKDLGAGREHGESSHRIQWYLISKIPDLDHPIDEIYCKLPGWKTTDEYKHPRYFYMWEFLVDRDGVPTNAAIIPFKTPDMSDFRAPSNVNRWLKDGRTGGLELLEACLTNRFNRRNAWVADEYMAKKLQIDLSTLSLDQRQKMIDFILSPNAVLFR